MVHHDWFVDEKVALIAIYSIALQTLLLGYLHASHLGFDSVAVICSNCGASNNHDRPFSPHGGTCDPCALACNKTCAGIVPPDAKFSIAPPDRLVGTPTAWVEAVSLPARHSPHASRAPPISA
jgi:hypothetical protein